MSTTQTGDQQQNRSYVEEDNLAAAKLLRVIAEMRKALEYFAGTLSVDTQSDMMLTIPTVFPAYGVGKEYKIKDVFSYGVNAVGDPQLYQVLQDHTSAEEHRPDLAVSLYKAIGIDASGYPEWVQPLGEMDAYDKGDVVSFKGNLYRSVIDDNVWSPDAYPAGWETVVDEP